MAIVTVHQAKTQLSKLIARAEAGEEIVIARGREPAVKLTPVGKPAPKRQFGSMRARMKKILLDSHTLFWFIDGNSRLSDAARGAIEAIDCIVCVSAVTAWEIASKFRLGKWPRAQALANDLPGIMSTHGFEPLSLS